jgi:hypothetical protein
MIIIEEAHEFLSAERIEEMPQVGTLACRSPLK